MATTVDFVSQLEKIQVVESRSLHEKLIAFVNPKS